MVSSMFANFFIASAGAGAALIGLLFVAISIRPDDTLGGGAHPLRKGVASGAFSALTNAFFVSMAALVPLANLGVIAVIVSLVSIASTLNLARGLFRGKALLRAADVRKIEAVRALATLGISLLLYGYEGIMGVGMLLHPHDVGFVFTLCELLLGVYAIGLARAWELLGGRGAAIGRLLNPLQTLDAASISIGASDAAQAPEANPQIPASTRATHPSDG